jgi:SAM-dependent methyltransferase
LSEVGSQSSPSFYEGQDLEALADVPNYYRWMLGNFHEYLKGNVIEIGAGLGHVSELYADSVEQLLLVEPAKNLHQRLAIRFASKPHVTTRCGLLDEVHAEEIASPGIDGAPYDAALLVNVLEHVEDDVRMLRQLLDLLRPRGALLLFVPALPFLYGALDSRVAHFRRYTRAGLADVVAQAGFKLELLKYFDVFGVVPWLIVGRLLRRAKHSERAAQIYDRLVVPVGRLLESQFPPPLGKNLVAIARRA